MSAARHLIGRDPGRTWLKRWDSSTEALTLTKKTERRLWLGEKSPGLGPVTCAW